MRQKALILTGGKGTRLYGINKDRIPKALMPLAPTTTFLDYTIDFLKQHNIFDICVSVKHQKEKVIAHIANKYINTKLKISVQIEPQDVGTAGALYLFAKKNREQFVALPVDYFYEENSENLFEEKMKDDVSLIWYATSKITPFTQPHVINNIYFDNKENNMVGYLSKADQKEKNYWNDRYNEQNTLDRASSIGFVKVNGYRYKKMVEKYNFTFPFCLYKDVMPHVIGTYGHTKEKIKVKKLDIDPVDMGIPERYNYIKQKHYENLVNCT